ncbi:hypothetical protein, partial [Ralstonia pseudosolanacearum]|uniref:hypothetical protein n=1 Tax=Ralstonia pseudosolanacearum TaxID=1310165 RepID=UPI001FF8C72F
MEANSKLKKQALSEDVVPTVELVHSRPDGSVRKAEAAEDKSAEKETKLASWKVLAPLIGALTVYAAHLGTTDLFSAKVIVVWLVDVDLCVPQKMS